MVEHSVLVAFRLGVVATGAIAALWSLRLALLTRGHRRTYLLLFLGFGLVSMGAVVEGLLFEIAGWDLQTVHGVEAFISSAGFGAILLAIVKSQV